MIETVGSESVATVAERYKQRGYQVVFEPDPSLLPKEAKSLHPDLLASKDDEHVIGRSEISAKSTWLSSLDATS